MVRIPYPMDVAGRAMRNAKGELDNHRAKHPDDEVMIDALAEVYEAAKALDELIAQRVREARGAK